MNIEQNKTWVLLTEGEESDQNKIDLYDIGETLNSGEILKVGTVGIKSVELRKSLQLMLSHSGKKADIMVTRSEATRKLKGERTTETVLVKAGEKSFADMIKEVKANIQPEQLGVEIEKIRRVNNDDVLIVTKKGGANILKNEINNKMSDVQVDSRIGWSGQRTAVEITDVEEDSTDDDILSSVKELLGIDGDEIDIRVKNRRKSRFGYIVTVVLPKQEANRLLAWEKIRIGWTWSRVRHKAFVRICINCLQIGHMSYNCPDKEKKKRCMRCTEVGHLAKNCQNEKNCIPCSTVGHSGNTAECPQYKKALHDEIHKVKRRPTYGSVSSDVFT